MIDRLLACARDDDFGGRRQILDLYRPPGSTMSQKSDSRVRARPTRSLWWRTIGVAGIASICSVLAVPDAAALLADPRASNASAVGLVANASGGSPAQAGSPAQGRGSTAVSGAPRTDAPSQAGLAPAVTGLPRSDAANQVGRSPAAGVPPGRVKPGILATADQPATGPGANLSPVLKKAATPGPVAGAADPSAQLMAKYRDSNAVGPQSQGGPRPQAGLPNKPGDPLNPDGATRAALAPRPLGTDPNAVGGSAACVDPVKGCNQSGLAVASTGTNWREVAHTTADLASFIPGRNVPAGLYNTVSYGAEGRTGEALLSAATIIPGGKWVTTAAKGAFKAFKLWKDARAADRLAVAAKGVDDVAETAEKHLPSGSGAPQAGLPKTHEQGASPAPPLNPASPDPPGVSAAGSDAASLRWQKFHQEVGDPKTFDPTSISGADGKDLENAIPNDWTRSPSKSGDGTVYADPQNKGRQIRIMPGYVEGNRLSEMTHGPYAVVAQNGVKTKIPLANNPTLGK